MALDIVILGPPGAGKGTQAKRISQEVGIPHIATGEMLREAIAAGDELGWRVKAIVNGGDLVPDDLMIDVARSRLAQPDTADGFILDGFPRTHAQALALDRILEELDRGELTVVLQFQVPDEVVVKRLLGRAIEEGRSDDTPETVMKRIAIYHKTTEPLVAYYRARGILVGIHAEGTVEEVFAEVMSVLEAAAAR